MFAHNAITQHMAKSLNFDVNILFSTEWPKSYGSSMRCDELKNDVLVNTPPSESCVNIFSLNHKIDQNLNRD